MRKEFKIRKEKGAIAKEIADALNAAGLKTKRGKAYSTWQVYQVARGSYSDENIERLLEKKL